MGTRIGTRIGTLIGTRIGSPPEAAFSPLDLGPVFWVRADLGIILNGSAVSTWEDQGPYGVDLTQPTASLQPDYIAADTDGLPSVSFVRADGHTMYAPHNEGFNLTKWTSCFWLYQPDGLSDGSHFYIAQDGGLSATSRYRFLLSVGGGGTTYTFTVILNGTSGNYQQNFAFESYLNAWTHVIVTWDGTDATPSNRFRVYFNNVSQSVSGTPPTSLNNATADHRLGGRIAGTDPFQGRWDDFLHFDRIITADERAQLYTYRPRAA